MTHDLDICLEELKDELTLAIKHLNGRDLTDEQRIQRWLDNLFAHGDELKIQAYADEGFAGHGYFDVNDFVKNEWREEGIILDWWNVRCLCELFHAKVNQMFKELEDADE